MNKNDITYLVGDSNITDKPLEIYSEFVCEFLDSLSKILMNTDETKKYPDVITFAFWCRKANILKLKSEYQSKYKRVGRGIVFHIAPSNVPINFAFSLAFGLLAGNSNIVRVSSKKFEQVDAVCECIKKCLAKQEFQKLKNYICVVRYLHNKEITDEFSMNCNCRVIWGGNDTINKIRESKISARTNEITFADRYSFAMFDERAIELLSEKELKKLVEKFYNDTYLMDQNACSSPKLIFWIKSDDGIGRKKFWEMLDQIVLKYDLTEKKVVDKYTHICEVAATGKCKTIAYKNNFLYVTTPINFSNKIEVLSGKFGIFYQIEIDKIEDALINISDKIQTVVTYGIDMYKLQDDIIKYRCKGIDRIVKIGSALDIGVFWDGYDVIGNMSRVIYL